MGDCNSLLCGCLQYLHAYNNIVMFYNDKCQKKGLSLEGRLGLAEVKKTQSRKAETKERCSLLSSSAQPPCTCKSYLS